MRAQADTGILRGIQSDRHQDKRTCWSHDVVQLEMTVGRVVWLPIIREYYVHGQTNWPIIT